MKKIILLFALAILFAACSSTKQALPFAPDVKYGKYPVKKNKPVKNNTSWAFRQWNHEGR